MTKDANRPLLSLTRDFMGRRELLVLFYTKRCQYQCAFCTLPSRSSRDPVSFQAVRSQLDHAFELAGDELAHVTQVAYGNEGSILDARTMPPDQLRWALERARGLPELRFVSLETRLEFVTERNLQAVLDVIAPAHLTVKAGLETVDDDLRLKILNKRLELQDFERKVALLGHFGVRLSCYVLLKPGPAQTDAEAIDEARATCEYLKRICRKHGTELMLRINSMYVARGSQWQRWAEAAAWVPPSVFDLARVMADVMAPGIPVYAGLFEEGLATTDGRLEAHPEHQDWAFEQLLRYNHSQDAELLLEVARGPR